MFTTKSKNLLSKPMSVIAILCATAALALGAGSAFATNASPATREGAVVPASTTGPKVNVQGFVNGTTGAVTDSKGVITVMNPAPGEWCIELGGTATPSKELMIATPEFGTSPSSLPMVDWESNAGSCNSLSVEFFTFDGNNGRANEGFSFIGVVR
jgi:hypothetical protein